MSAARRPSQGSAVRSTAPARPNARLRQRRRLKPQPPPSPGYIAFAEASLAAAAAAPDPVSRELHQEECKLWLMLAAQRREIEGVMALHQADDDPAA